MQLTLKKLKTLINEVLSETTSNLPPEKMEKLMKLLKNEDPSYIAQGIQIALGLGMTEDEIMNLAYHDNGWQQNGTNWVLLEEFPTNQIFTNLTELDLHKTGLTSIPDSIGNLTNLTELDLSWNQLTSLPDSIGNLTNLIRLWLHKNQLTSLPDSFGNLTNLTTLDLSENPIDSLPTTLVALGIDASQWESVVGGILQQFQALKYLDLRNCYLQFVPSTIGMCTSLVKLDLSQNSLKRLPDSIGNLTNLTKLNLSNNQLRELPDSFGNLTNLKHLDISYNKFLEWPEIIKKKLKTTEIESYNFSTYRR